VKDCLRSYQPHNGSNGLGAAVDLLGEACRRRRSRTAGTPALTAVSAGRSIVPGPVIGERVGISTRNCSVEPASSSFSARLFSKEARS
jgi:hypothetical protein